MTIRSLSSRSSSTQLYAWTLANLDDRLQGSRFLTDRRPAATPHTNEQRIYILGIGNVGRLFAACLAKLEARLPITLVVNRLELLQEWAKSPGVEMVRNGTSQRITEFDIEWWTDQPPPQGPIREPASGQTINNLIITTKASQALPQVDRLLPYLDQSSTIAFAQNGMCKLWPPLGAIYVKDRFPPGSEPSWLACVVTHGVTSLGPFKSLHASPAGVMVGSVSNSKSGPATSSSNFLSRQLCNAPDLEAKSVSQQQLWIAQLEKLAVNIVINPLTAILNCKNGEILVDRGDDLPKLIRTLLSETSQVFQALVEDASSESVLVDDDTRHESQCDSARLAMARAALIKRFSPDNLMAIVYSVGAKVAENTSSMLQDTLCGKPTEIHDLNGWLIETQKALCAGKSRLPVNQALIDLVTRGEKLGRKELCDYLLSFSPQ
ncbi:ketopantoate reductase PanE/ApbA C terminal-domain-containing protein [Microdochium trichocladiopsis]|uniref:Ketopantoate reductase PanE/ApbA C terminal-domain-containing protein n=1 Tax=Microdochium trichocladiopsis TaxID=1682393 RepID=A0A9P8YEP4_9PEZI|nr:ketopantoate reductase PanE/ApbA C terminal-domain-containing protein [Microdochium trichocladiopsis]KAH7038075.1 ketopantoate reductase PanE/ApbA C terminal-domain-containing protein [Microdochium trichocladiopsis]